MIRRDMHMAMYILISSDSHIIDPKSRETVERILQDVPDEEDVMPLLRGVRFCHPAGE